METDKAIDKKADQAVKVVCNDDCAIIDFLAELNDRDAILRNIDDLNNRIKEENLKNFMFLIKAKHDNLIILIICNPTFVKLDKGNKYILYSHTSLRQLCIFFARCQDTINPSETEILEQIRDIYSYLTYQWAQEQDKKHR